MKKSKKVVLSLFSIMYLIGISLLVWPHVVGKVITFLSKLGFRLDVTGKSFIYYYGLLLLGLTLLVWILVLVWPAALPDVVLRKTRAGRLALSNDGIQDFIKIKLSNEDLYNIKVKFKNTHRRRKFLITADSIYRQSTIKELPRISQELTKSITELLSGTDETPTKVNIKINKRHNSKHESIRVV